MPFTDSVFMWLDHINFSRYLNYIVYILCLGLLANKFLSRRKRSIELLQLATKNQRLLKELQHRIKNNLQIVISLLNTQSEYLKDDKVINVVQSIQHRIYAISLIHKKLYQTNNSLSIDISWYIKELVNYLKDSFTINNKIKFELNIKSVQLDVEQAVPLGLILNEAITNAIKYAFPEKGGLISISFKEISKNEYKLSIADNGIGFSTGINYGENNTLGMNLMKGLTEQLDGTFKITSKNGITVTIEFIKKESVI